MKQLMLVLMLLTAATLGGCEDDKAGDTQREIGDHPRFLISLTVTDPNGTTVAHAT